jgi:hypothetical protein
MSALARHIPIDWSSAGWPRLAVLYLLARGMPVSLGLVIAAGSLYGVLRGWASSNEAGGFGQTEVVKQFAVVHVIPALMASVIGIGAWSPFGEPERAAASSMPRLRLLHLGVVLATVGVLTWVYLAAWTSRAPDVDLEWAAFRNLLGMTGAALLLGRVVDARLSWLAPLATAVVGVFTAMMASPGDVWSPAWWIWSGQPSDFGVSWVIAAALFVAGVALYLRDGARDTAGEEE